MMFVDEASYILQSPIVAKILVQIRKYKCSFVAATQLWAQIAQDVRPAVLGSTGIRIVGKLGHDEATVLARDMETTVETIKGLEAVPRLHAQWCYFVRSVTKKGTVVTAPYGVLEQLPKVNQLPDVQKLVRMPPRHPLSDARAPPLPPKQARPNLASEPVATSHPFEIKPGKDWETERK